MRIGIECGGTFTDLVVLDEDGRIIATNKVFSTPDDPSRAVIEALEGIDPQLCQDAELLHGSTVATNALLERKGGPIGLVTTAGFRDIPFLRRQDRKTMYDLRYVSPQPLIERRNIVEVGERLTADGTVHRELDDASVRDAAKILMDAGVASVAVALLHSYANPDHEVRVRELLRETGVTVPISLSHEVAREFREFERYTTTTVEAFIRPRVSTYLERLDRSVAGLGIRSLGIMQSNGGIVNPQTVIEHPVTMLLSGPAAGVAGAITVGNRAELRDIVTLDMGGTSTDVAFIRDGHPDLQAETVIDGLPIRVPLIDIHTVGAGGGSIIRIDSGGLLTVGPDSAGADPGPACYGRGGTAPTITDANVVTGIIPSDTLIAGRFAVDRDAAFRAFQPLADALGTDVYAVAGDAIRLANVAMAGAIREVSLERGHELEAASIVAYGGAGALHAAAVADEIGIDRVVVPPYSGLTSAYGLLAAAFQRDFAFTWFQDDCAKLDAEQLRHITGAQLSDAMDAVTAFGVDAEGLKPTWIADMRYRGQGFELSVLFDPDSSTAVADMIRDFHGTHARQFGHSDDTRVVQLVTIRLRLAGPSPELVPPRTPPVDTAPVSAALRFAGGEVAATIAHRGQLSATTLSGPAVVVDVSATTFVPAGWRATVDDHHNLVVQRNQP
ncbi:hydantoinase [Mycolicibacterium murale]|uniref:Hydantoinase n=1 Tax=Mycolicibacterium murale TaxID=182220 RepID=A0A7I9WIU4_9MYCO|nr:hydantoinase/oxoprolinase family protein [Mycolicibacterium murale]MCV7183878.1 hydantoinase/oxoprolinase family protein [Mycolicibacterium murale]GFG57651.1 hydantoinase [Mycolicibacterium murale]